MMAQGRGWVCGLVALCAAWSAQAEVAIPAADQGDWIAADFQLANGERLQRAKFHYLTVGKPRRNDAGDVTNAVLLLHGTTNVGAEFLAPSMATQLFGPGQPLDAAKYFIIMPDGLGRGGSSKPSDGLRGQFPHYGYQDLVTGQYRLITEGLGIRHLRLVLGVSMGGMNAWQWAERFPDMMDAVMPIACMPTQISGRNLLIRRIVTESIRHDPDWNGGNYKSQPHVFLYTAPLFSAVTQGAATLQDAAPNYAAGVAYYDKLVERARKAIDANDYLFGLEASFDYDPEPGLDRIKAKLVAVNFADDLLNPAELGLLEKLVARVPQGKAVLVPVGPESNGHFTLLQAKQWRSWLEELLASLPAQPTR